MTDARSHSARPGGLRVLGLMLALLPLCTACAPTQASVPAGTFLPLAQDLARICDGNARVTVGGELLWDAPDGPETQAAPYLVACRSFTLGNDGRTVHVQDDTLTLALTHFDPDAHFLTYYADLQVRFPQPDVLSADPTDSVPDALQEQVRAVRVTVTRDGLPDHALLQGGAVTALRYDPGMPLTVTVAGDAVPWPVVRVQAQRGLIEAPLR